MSAVLVTVVTGFLGAGKTTLVNRWLADAERGDVAVIVNEHGAVGIDGALVAARVQMLVEIAGGCVCCATQAELVRALTALSEADSPPKRVLVETSGAASPAGVLHAIAGASKTAELLLDGVVTVVDARRVDALGSHDLAREQIGYADVVVLSRTDLCDAAHAKAVVAAMNGAAAIVDTDEPMAASLARRRGELTRAPPALVAHEAYDSIALVLDGDIDGERFADFMESELARHSSRLFRTKGILAVEGVAERMIVQGVADEVEVTFGDRWDTVARTCRLVVIGFGLDRDALTRAFTACRASG